MGNFLTFWKRTVQFILLIIIMSFHFSCNQEENELTQSYAGSPTMSKITVEEGTFKPRVTWSGGYISVIGANKGNVAKLDGSLIWLIKNNSNDIRYPVTFGSVPEGSQSILNQFGGVQMDSLVEDFTYTYWVLKGNLWDQIAQHPGKILITDSSLPAGTINVVGDSLRISQHSFAKSSQAIDLFTNIKDIQVFGRLGRINIIQAVDSRGPIIKWEITQAGVTDTKLSAIGIVMAQRYSPTNQIWEIWSEEDSPQGKIFGKKNIISAPIYAGTNISGSRVFQAFPEEGLVRGKDYYIWIANSSWDGKNHGRTVNGYAYAYFKTW